MSFLPPFIAGAVVGSVVTSGLKRGWFRRSTRATIAPPSTVEATELDAPATEPVAPATDVAATSDSPQISAPDQLEDIKGIGPVYANRLREAGIATYAALAALTPERVMAILSPDGSEGRLIHVDEWIAQAHKLSNQTAS